MIQTRRFVKFEVHWNDGGTTKFGRYTVSDLDSIRKDCEAYVTAQWAFKVTAHVDGQLIAQAHKPHLNQEKK